MNPSTSPIHHKNVFAKFRNRDFRPYQQEAVEFAFESDKPIVCIEAPTGAGKSLIGMVTGQMSGNMFYLCHTRHLQQQIIDDFPEADKLWGRSNYACLQNPLGTAAECMHSKATPCEFRFSYCPYETAKQKVLGNSLGILNYDYFLFECNYVGRMSGRDVIICDESDTLERILSGFISLQLPFKLIKSLGIEEPKYVTPTEKNGLACWKEWAEEVGVAVIQRGPSIISEVGRRYKDPQKKVAAENKMKKRLDGLMGKLEMFEKHVDGTWIFDRERMGGYLFRPTWVSEELAYQYFFRHGLKFVLMSATMEPMPSLAKLNGLNVGDIDYMYVPSNFDPKRRPVIFKPCANMTKKTHDEEIDKLVAGIRQVMDKHPNEKGLIHTTSYRVANDIMDRIHSDRLITHDAQNRIAQVEMFMESSQPLVLVSPSTERGVSLEEDKCRFIIWAKAPFLNLGDKLTSNRLYGGGKIGELWYRSNMIQTVIQGVGRGMRSAEDRCVTYILDKQIIKAMGSSASDIPAWFKEAITI